MGTKDFDGAPDQNLVGQEVNGSKEETRAPAEAESNLKPAIDSTGLDLSAKKRSLLSNLS